MTDIQYGIKIMGGREVSRPYRFFSPKASGFYPFDDATALAGEGGVGDVVWLIQASASNHKPKEPSLWFAGFFQSLLNYHWGNLYIISQKKSGLPDDEAIPIFKYLRKCM